MRLIGRLRSELGVNTICGASNISFGLPNRHILNGTFLAMAAGAGMTSAIMNPLHPEEMTSIMAADVMNGVDANCARWIRKYREAAPATIRDGSGQDGSGERPRRERRRRRG